MPINLTIIKKSGKRVPYNSNNVYNAIRKGFLAMRQDCDADIRLVFNSVEQKIQLLESTQTFLSVNVVQDIIIATMVEHGYLDVAEDYDRYRKERDRMRASFTGRQNKLVKAFEKLTVDADENNEKRERDCCTKELLHMVRKRGRLPCVKGAPPKAVRDCFLA
jgi:anaerobic ribonucleoside-triphosphate reductase